MAVVVIEGLLALVLVLAGLREAIMHAVPLSLKLAIGVGIGLFITLVGLREGGIVVNDPATGIGLGDLTAGPPLIALGGIAVAIVLAARQRAGRDHPRRASRPSRSAWSSACSRARTASRRSRRRRLLHDRRRARPRPTSPTR